MHELHQACWDVARDLSHGRSFKLRIDSKGPEETVTDSYATDLYIGTWRLVPELCLYQHGEHPASGIYEIGVKADEITVGISWRDAEGNTHEITYGGIPDGRPRETDAPGATHFSMTRVNSRVLDSAAFADGRQVAFARRAASSDGSLLATVQRGSTASGEMFSNFQVYRRDPSR